MRCENNLRVHIKFLLILLILSLLFPIQIKASENPPVYQTTSYFQQPGVLYAPIDSVVTELEAAYQASQKTKTTSYGTNCVRFLQNYLYGHINLDWGPGGRNLPLDQTPAIGSVVVFTYTHVAYVKDIADGNLILLESNYKSGQITQDRQVPIGDATIRGYYHPRL